MFIAPSSAFHISQSHTPPTGVAPVRSEPAPATPVEILLHTSRDDYKAIAHLFEQECAQHGVHGRVVYVEDLDGTIDGDKLIQEHQLMGELLTRGDVIDSTLIIALHHGSMRTDLGYYPADPFAQYIGRTGGEYNIIDAGDESKTDDADDNQGNEKISDANQPESQSVVNQSIRPEGGQSKSDPDDEENERSTPPGSGDIDSDDSGSDSESSDLTPIHATSTKNDVLDVPTLYFDYALRHVTTESGKLTP